MDYNKIPKVLKNFSFESKMAICQIYSRKIMQYTKLDVLRREIIYPWELEVFALFSLMTVEGHESKELSEENTDILNEIFSAIRLYEDPALYELEPTIRFADRFLMVTGQLQFKTQVDIRLRIFRYRFLFEFVNTEIDMRKVFCEKYELTYDQYYKPIFLLYFIFSLDPFEMNVNSILEYLIFKYSSTLNKFVINRETLIKDQLSKLPRGIDSYYYGFKYLYPTPIIENNKKYFFPIPYLLVDAITESFLTKLTIDNQRLRETIGKEVIQNYLLYILKESNVYDEIFEEFVYYKGKNKMDTPDVLVRKGDICILFDSKSSVPNLGLRQFDDLLINRTIEQYAKNVIQLYKQILDFNLFNPFENIHFDKSNIFGVVVLFEDSFVPRRLVYEEVRRELCISSDSDEFKYIKSHIKIVELLEMEKASFESYDYSGCLVVQRDDPDKWFNLTFIELCDTKKAQPIRAVSEFFQECFNLYMDTVQELVEAGIIIDQA